MYAVTLWACVLLHLLCSPCLLLHACAFLYISSAFQCMPVLAHAYSPSFVRELDYYLARLPDYSAFPQACVHKKERITAVLSKLQQSNCFASVSNRPLRGHRGRFGTLLQQLEWGNFERTAVFVDFIDEGHQRGEGGHHHGGRLPTVSSLSDDRRGNSHWFLLCLLLSPAPERTYAPPGSGSCPPVHLSHPWSDPSRRANRRIHGPSSAPPPGPPPRAVPARSLPLQFTTFAANPHVRPWRREAAVAPRPPQPRPRPWRHEAPRPSQIPPLEPRRREAPRQRPKIHRLRRCSSPLRHPSPVLSPPVVTHGLAWWLPVPGRV